MKAMVLQVGVLGERGTPEKKYHHQESHFFLIILLCSSGQSYLLLLQKRNLKPKRERSLHKAETLISHAYVCALLGTKINPWNCVLREYE